MVETLLEVLNAHRWKAVLAVGGVWLVGKHIDRGFTFRVPEKRR
jgi:hypothetical protein